MIVDRKTGQGLEMMPCRCFDANGLEWENVIRCDTETGEITRFQTGPNGGLILNVVSKEIERETLMVAAPLHLERIKCDA